MMLVESGDDLLAVDCGLMFPDDELPGIDHVIPDFSYALARRDGLRAVLLTHGHEDHIGALPYLLREAPVPVYGTPMTLSLVGERLREHGLLESADLRPMRPRARFDLGPFGIEPIRVTHSLVDGIGLAIQTPVGTIVHTGDFKLDPTPLDGEAPDYRRFAALGERGVAVLCSDSTNVDRPGHTRSEVEVGQALGGRFDVATGRIIVATFAAHIHRIQQVLLSTGSQGEPHSALSLMAAGEHKYVKVERGDLVIISARVIPGHERTIGRVVNALYRLGAEVLYEDNAFVHVSGHASQEDLKLMLSLTRPRYFVPVHGEYRHLLSHARLAESVGIGPDRVFLIEDGMGVEVSKTTARLVGPFPAGRVLVDGKSIGDIGAVVLRDRQLLSEDGLVAVSLAVDREGAVVAGPEIASRGFVYVKENEPLLEELKKAVLAALAERDPRAPSDREQVGATVRSTVRHFVNQRFRR